MYVHSLVC